MIEHDPQEWADEIGVPLMEWKSRCHEISLAVLKADLIDGRVARGWCKGIGSQHSWIAKGDPYDPETIIIDPTWWAWHSADKPLIFVGSINVGLHEPHGAGDIWQAGKPTPGKGPVIPRPEGLSDEATAFLDLLEPLDWQGWSLLLSSGPVGGWPAAEIVSAAIGTELEVIIPIDRIGMLTDENPGGLYW